jgi:hypothetical protein
LPLRRPFRLRLGYLPDDDGPPASTAWIAALFVFAGMSTMLVAVAVLASGEQVMSKRRQAQFDARTIHAVAEKYVVDHPDRCPTVALLQDEKEISPASVITDPWGIVYTVECHGDDIVVRSAGPDRVANTVDDVTARSPVIE